MNIYIDLIGYVASVVVVISVLMNSILRFRWVNLVGAIAFTIYGVLIGAVPVAAVNGFIILINSYYLIKLYGKKETFKLLSVDPSNKYLWEFLDFHSKEITQFSPHFSTAKIYDTEIFFVLRNVAVAGIIIGKQQNEEMEIVLDYVIPEYRDFKLGRFIYIQNKHRIAEKGVKRITASAFENSFRNYLLKMGFTPENNSETLFVLEL